MPGHCHLLPPSFLRHTKCNNFYNFQQFLNVIYLVLHTMTYIKLPYFLKGTYHPKHLHIFKQNYCTTVMLSVWLHSVSYSRKKYQNMIGKLCTTGYLNVEIGNVRAWMLHLKFNICYETQQRLWKIFKNTFLPLYPGANINVGQFAYRLTITAGSRF
jgi:hypothetical protein